MLGRKVAVAFATLSALFVSAAAHATRATDAIPTVTSSTSTSGSGSNPGGAGDNGQGKNKGKGNDSAG